MKTIISEWIVFRFFFNATATTEIYTLSLHDALPISHRPRRHHPDVAESPSRSRSARLAVGPGSGSGRAGCEPAVRGLDRKSTRLNSSHPSISYAVFCLKKKKDY